MKEYDVTITETLKKTVTVEADSPDEAKQTVTDRWINGEYILDAESFADVEFNARAKQRNKEYER